MSAEPAAPTEAAPARAAAAAAAGPRREVLIPIHLEREFGDRKLQESFMWNYSNPGDLTPLAFAHTLCRELGLAESHRVYIARDISRQIEAYRAPDRDADAGIEGVAHDMPVLISISIRLGSILYEDRVEWDPTSPFADPEAFARRTAAEAELPSSFVPLIAHTIREQVGAFYTQIVGGDIQPGDLYVDVPHVRRLKQDLSRWQPAINPVSNEEAERVDARKERSQRYMRRKGRGMSRGVVVQERASRPLGTDVALADLEPVVEPPAKKQKIDAPAEPEVIDLTGRCHNCRIRFEAAPVAFARRGPDGPATLCNPCGLHWAWKGGFPHVRGGKS